MFAKCIDWREEEVTNSAEEHYRKRFSEEKNLQVETSTVNKSYRVEQQGEGFPGRGNVQERGAGFGMV